MDQIDIKLDQYFDKFGKVFPMMEYNLSKNEAIKFIDKCIKKNKTAQEIEPLPDDVIY